LASKESRRERPLSRGSWRGPDGYAHTDTLLSRGRL